MLDTIVALATPPMMGAIAVIRLSGPEALQIVSKSFTKDLTKLTKREIVYGKIYEGDELVDEVLLSVFVGPHSFTGEDVVEISCHGSMLIANEIITLMVKNGARLAVPGEFSNRAFINGKLDLVQAEAINDMISATTSEAKKLSLLSLTGETSKIVYPIREKIADLISLIEVNIDYPEYLDIEEANYEKIIAEVTVINKEIKRLISEGKQGQIIKEGLKVAIVGKPNVGKSSLLNALLQEEKAIVTNIAGTTRDVVEGEINFKGIKLLLLDTAGIRESVDAIEKVGITKSKETIAKADLVIYVKDARDIKEDNTFNKLIGNKKVITVYNKADLATEKQETKLYISALQNDLSSLEKAILEVVGVEEQSYVRPSLNNARQIALLTKTYEELEIAKSEALNNVAIDLVSVSLQQAFFTIKEILGETSDQDLSKEIFSRFCIGK
ncbi:MAG TPA: tRNA uridine-5-carboxymethylaminomethyl(34) synthesis GTPase MnmE [Bacilli bacterium]|nr:tRNA uridine-5-carboxymethylaminomethyl(34) synthesis GTPase MnmE [Bacilli bacterium]